MHFERTSASERLEHWVNVVAPFALGVHAWSIGSALVVGFVLIPPLWIIPAYIARGAKGQTVACSPW